MRDQTVQSLIYLLWGDDSSYRTENRWVKTTRVTLQWCSCLPLGRCFARGRAAAEVSSSKGRFKVTLIIILAEHKLMALASRNNNQQPFYCTWDSSEGKSMAWRAKPHDHCNLRSGSVVLPVFICLLGVWLNHAWSLTLRGVCWICLACRSVTICAIPLAFSNAQDRRWANLRQRTFFFFFFSPLKKAWWGGEEVLEVVMGTSPELLLNFIFWVQFTGVCPWP